MGEEVEEQADAAGAFRADEFRQDRGDLCGAVFGEKRAPAAEIEQLGEAAGFGEQLGNLVQKRLGKLDDAIPQRDDRALGHIGNPVVRQVRPGQDQLAGSELADMVADVAAPRGGDDVVDLKLGVEMPADGVEGQPVLPGLEGLALADLDDFEIRLHRPPLSTTRVPLRGMGGHFRRRPMTGRVPQRIDRCYLSGE